jgi:hypothetical protein
MTRITAPAAAFLAVLLALVPSVLVGFAAAPAYAASAEDGPVTWSVEPSPTTEGGRRAFNYDVDPGTQIQDSFLITNAGTTSADFVIYATDAVNDPDTGEFNLLAKDDVATDLGAWITPADTKLTIGPGLQATVPFNLLVPSDAAPGDHAAGIVASVFTETQQDGSTVLLEQRVGVRMYITVSGDAFASIETQGLTSSFNPSLNPFAPGELTVSYQVRNTGNKRVDVAQAIRVEGPFGIPLGSTSPTLINNLLPRQVVRVNVQLNGIGALLYALSTISLQPGAVGSSPTVGGADPGATPAPTPGSTESAAPATPAESAAPAETSTPAADATSAPAPTPGATDAATGAPIDPDQTTVDYAPVSSQTFTIAITWTLLLLIVLVIAAIYLIVRYVSGTRERLYAAIDEAAAAAREEALASKDEKPTT